MAPLASEWIRVHGTLHFTCSIKDQLEMATAPKECVGPSHLSQEQKPSATVSAKVPFDNVHVLSQTPQLIALLS